jgi:NADPH-dependent glutamate synthase beta subunit-like oxidoreductase
MISDLNIQVNRDLCTACGTCVERCIMDNLRLHIAPCRVECPLHMNCQGYVRLLARGKGEQAAEELRKYTPFGGILGRVCHHPCESVCERSKNGDGAVNIRAIKRYLADHYPQITRSLPDVAADTGKRIAIIGSGPAGMMAAYDLRVSGHAVTVYEADTHPGGMLRWEIPAFRLPVREVDVAIQMLEQMGILFKTGQTFGRDFELRELLDGFDAVLLAYGAGTPLSLKILGEELAGVWQGIDFLKKIKAGENVSIGKDVIIIGGGNVAVDAALTCVKLGARDVKIVCLEQGNEMPAFRDELEEAIEEGVGIENGWGPRKFFRTDKGRIGVETSKCLRLFDEGGAFCPILDQNCCIGFEADNVIVAIGQRPTELSLPQADSPYQPTADPITLQSKIDPRVFFSGDALTGPRSVVEALAQGREAALSIHRSLGGERMYWGRDCFVENGHLPYTEPDLSRAKGKGRGRYERLPIIERTLTLEVENCFTKEAALQEAERCLSCGRAADVNQTCWFCLPCEIECPEEALKVCIPYLVR